MTGEQKQLILGVIRTLDRVTVCGAGNMDMLLGCIRALSDVIKEKDGGEKDGGI